MKQRSETLKKYTVAITGGIGSGKSTVASLIKERGFPVFSCDEINRELLSQKDYFKTLTELFPDTVEGGIFQKSKLASRIFSDPAALKKLNEFSHPVIMKKLKENMEKAQATLVFAEVPLLLEEGYEKEFDAVLIVFRDEKTRIDSVSARDGVSPENVLARIHNQYDYASLSASAFPKKLGHTVFLSLKNDGSLAKLKADTETILRSLLASAK